jgi:chromosome segregation ATPase
VEKSFGWLVGEVDKLEGVKERQESERLELAADLQAAWDQIHAVREREANLTTELIDVKDQQIEEKLRFDGLVQKLNVQLRELEEQKSQSEATIKELSTRLNELQNEQVNASATRKSIAWVELFPAKCKTLMHINSSKQSTSR